MKDDDPKDEGGPAAQGTNGTKKIVPPDSPKLGHLFALNSIISPDGDMQIKRTLIDAGEGNDLSEATDVNSNFATVQENFFPEGATSAEDAKLEHQPPEEVNQSESHQPVLEVLQEKEEVEVHAEPQKAIEMHEEEIQKFQQETNHVDSKSSIVDEPKLETADNEQKNETDELESAAQETIKEEKLDVQESQSMNLNEKPKPEVEESVGGHAIDVEEKLKAAINEQNLESHEEKEVKDDTQKNEEKQEVEIEGETMPTATKPHRTTAKTTGSHFMLPWQKKPAVSHSEPEHESPPVQAEPTSTKTIANPLAGMMKNFKKGIKSKIGGSSKSGVDSAPERILQKSGSRPSPRIVSSLNMAPTHENDVPEASETPTTLRRKELDEILSAMPPSPAHSVDSVKENEDFGCSSHIYDNLPANQQIEKTPETPAEDEICPSVASKPVLTTIKQSITEKKAHDLIESIQVTGVADTAQSDIKPPRSPPPKSDQTNVFKPHPRNLPPPPRPSAPPKNLQKSYTMATSRPPLPRDLDVIGPTINTSSVYSTPVQMRVNDAGAAATLERPKLYRSKQETKIAKRATAPRPITVHQTTFLVKEKNNGDLNKSFDQNAPRPKSTQKVVFEQKDSFTLPKFLVRNKKKSIVTPLYSSSLATSPSIEANANRCEEKYDIAPMKTNVQCSMPQVLSPDTISVGVQTSPRKPKPPISSLHGRASPLKTPPASPLGAIELQLPFIGERLANQGNSHEDAESSLIAYSQCHKMLMSEDEDEETASEKLVSRCLQEYRAACVRLRSVDLRGEFGAFQWLYGDPSEVGWSKRGVLEECNSLELFHDHVKQIDFVKLPPIQHSVGSIVYPESTVDEMLSAWINNGHSQAPATPNRSECSKATEPPFHPAPAILRLSDLIQGLAKLEQPFRGVQASISLAVLLSIAQCSESLVNHAGNDEKPSLNLDPAKIVIICSPSNSLVLFHTITDFSGDWNVQKLLLEMCPDHSDSLEAAINACIESLSLIASTKMHLPALFEAIAPPDWVTQAVALAAIEKCGK